MKEPTQQKATAHDDVKQVFTTPSTMAASKKRLGRRGTCA